MKVLGSAFLAFMVHSTVVYAEEILRVESPDNSSKDSQNYQESVQADQDTPHNSLNFRSASQQITTSAEDLGSKGKNTEDLYLMGGIWPGSDSFAGTAMVGYPLSHFFGLEFSASYYRFDKGGDSSETYGPEVDLVLRGHNPTPVTPFAGAGPGYKKWHRRDDRVVFSDSKSLTAVGFVGIDIALTKHFGLSALRKRCLFLEDQPRKFSDHTLVESRDTIVNQIGFHLVL